jgi:hypothetical protein
MRRALGRKEFYPGLYSPSYCSAPQTWQTAAHRLMRDRHRRQILNRLRHHTNEDASAVKTRITIFWNIASRLSCEIESLSGMNYEQCRPAGLTLCLARVSTRAGSRTLGMSVDSAKGCVAGRLPQDYSQVATTAGATSGKVFSHR